jgi:WD40 repeat protein
MVVFHGLFISPSVILVLFFHCPDIITGNRSYMFGQDRSIGTITVHPNGNYFVLGGKGMSPNIYIYEYPSKKLYRVLKKGTERAYSSISFSYDGDKLASVGSAPDYMLTVWDWQQERIILRSKAFSQEVFNVTFYPLESGKLTTSGTGHIRFWEMAETFTGLKLQGDLGKFGKVELSDISGYTELPDGKVLSGSESGSLLMWDGNFIKFEISRIDGSPPHEVRLPYTASNVFVPNVHVAVTVMLIILQNSE